jgi:general stress protein 26
MIKKLKTDIVRRLLDLYKQNKQNTFNSSLDHCLNTAHLMLKKSKYCILITNSEKQCPSARMVQPIVDRNTFTIWLGTNPNLKKIKEIEKNPYVTLAFSSDKEHANLIIYGKADIVRDIQEKKNHWISSWRLFFPNGPSSDDFVSLRIEPLKMELMNFKKSVVPEPFGLNPVKIIKKSKNWEIL